MATDKQIEKQELHKLLRDIEKAKKQLLKTQFCENFGQNKVRELRDKYSKYMSGNWSVCEPFVKSIQSFDNWCSSRTYADFERN